MSRRNLIIIIVSAVVLITGLFFLFFSGNNKNTTTSTGSTTSPFGNSSGNKFVNSGNKNGTSSPQGNFNPGNVPALAQIYKNPTSGSVFFTSKSTSSSSTQNILRFIDRATGNAYEYIPESNTNEPIRITNTTIPKIEEAIWSPKGNNVVLRYLDNDTDNINTFSGEIKAGLSTSSSLGEITGTYLASNINQLAIDPLGTKVFEFFEKKDGSGSYGMTTLFNGTSKKQIFDSQISLFNISWPKENIITFTTKPSSQYGGFMFFFNTDSKITTKILSNITGLSTLTNNDASLVAYSESQSNSFDLGVYNVKNKTFINFTIPTLVDKCVWGIKNNKILYCAVPNLINPGSYPDSWYQGLESFSDDIWEIDTVHNISTILYQIGNGMDVVNPKISLDDSYMEFSNKNDLSLWILKLANFADLPFED